MRAKVNKGKDEKVSKKRMIQMSFNFGLDRVQETMVLALMLIFFVGVFYSDIGLFYKIVVSVLVFSIILLVGVANQAIKQKENTRF